MSNPDKPDPVPEDGPPPILGTWRRLYAAVLVVLAVLIVLFYLLGRAFQ